MKKILLSLSLILANAPTAQADELSLEDKTHAGLALAGVCALGYGAYSFKKSYNEYKIKKDDSIYKKKAKRFLIDDAISIFGIREVPMTMLAGTLALWISGTKVTGGEYMTIVGERSSLACVTVMTLSGCILFRDEIKYKICRIKNSITQSAKNYLV